MRLPSRPNVSCFGKGRSEYRTKSGAVLLEVVLALVLFVGAAAILTSAMSSSLDSVERLRFNTHAADLAVSVMSELQLGIKTLAASGPQQFEIPLEDWSWEAVATSLQPDSDETNAFKRVEVIIRHDEPAVVYRLSQVLRLDSTNANGGDLRPGISSF